MKEVTGPQLFELQVRIQGMPFTPNDPYLVWRLVRAWEVTTIEDTTLYKVEIVSNNQIPLRGLLIWPIRDIYFDWQSMMFLVNQAIQTQLDAFNAGYHWRYKGL